MSDDDGSSSIIRTILGLVLLFYLWPYILGVLALYVVYLAVIEVLIWISNNWLIVLCALISSIFFYVLFKSKLRKEIFNKKTNKRDFQFSNEIINSTKIITDPIEKKSHKVFIASTNLYCYWCARKLGIQAYELTGKYHCDSCNTKFRINNFYQE